MNQIITKNASGALQKVYTPPPGEIMLYAGDTVPDGWLPCAGALVSRSAYPELFAAVGTKYGVGDGSTTFALPDARDRYMRGKTDAESVGALLADGLPELYGGVVMHSGGVSTNISGVDGVFASVATLSNAYRNGGDQTSGASSIGQFNFRASRYNSIYGAATRVQPKSILMLACIKY